MHPTDGGGCLYAGNERIEPADPQNKPFKNCYAASPLKTAHPEKPWWSIIGWCTNPECKKIYEKEGRDPHDPASSGIAPSDIKGKPPHTPFFALSPLAPPSRCMHADAAAQHNASMQMHGRSLKHMPMDDR